jgi:hypothetical protein
MWSTCLFLHGYRKQRHKRPPSRRGKGGEGFHTLPYIRENYDTEGFVPIPDRYYGQMALDGVADSPQITMSSAPGSPCADIKTREDGKPVIFEEELSFPQRFVEMAEG